MSNSRTPETERALSTPQWHQKVTSSNLDTPPVDSETAALFRATLLPVISQSPSWTALADRLRQKGYGLAMRDGRLFLTSHETGARVCSFRFLGLPLADMVARLGRPIVRALPGQGANGEIRTAQPQT